MTNTTPEQPHREPDAEPEPAVAEPEPAVAEPEPAVAEPAAAEPVEAHERAGTAEPVESSVAEPVEAPERREVPEPAGTAEPAAAPRRATYEPAPRDADDGAGYEAAPVASAAHISGSSETGQTNAYERTDTAQTSTESSTSQQPTTQQPTSEQPTSEQQTAATYSAPQALYVAAPEPPKRKGNRGGGILIALLATIVYAIISALVVLVIFFVTKRTADVAVHEFVQYLATASYFVPILFFFLAFILLVAIVNRGGWWAYVLGAFFVGVIVYFAYIGGVLLTIQAWQFSPSAVGRILSQLWANPLTIGAAIVAREVPIWFGAWIARRGKKMRERNDEAQREHERQLAAGPQPIQRTV